MALPFALSAGELAHSLADHHGGNDYCDERAKAVTHGHWHELGAEDHDHFPCAPSGDFQGLRPTAGESAAPTVGESIAGRAPDLATEFRPPRPAGTALLHHLSLLRI